MNNTSFRSIVCSLQLWNIDDVSTHTRSCYKASITETYQFLPINCSTLFLLSSPMLSGCTGAIECAIQICCHNILVMIKFSVESRTLNPWNSRVCDKDIETTIEVSYSGVDSLFDSFERGNVDLVCFTCLFVKRLALVVHHIG